MMKGKLVLVAALSVAGSLFAADGTQDPNAPKKEWGAKYPIQFCADIRSIPAMLNPQALTDGDIGSGTHFVHGAEAGSEVAIAFGKQPVQVTHVRFVQQHLAAHHYRLLAATENPTNFNVVVADREDKDGPVVGQWVGFDVSQKVYAVKLAFVAGNVGYRKVFPNLCELEVYVAGNAPNSAYPNVSGTPLRAYEVKQMPELKRDDLTVRMCTDWWNWDMWGWRERNKKSIEEGKGEFPWDEMPAFKSRLAELRELGANEIRLFAEMEAYSGKEGGFSSFPLEGVKEQYPEVMPAFTKAAHKHGFKVYYFSHAWRSPIQYAGKQAADPWKRWDFPYMQSDTIVGVNDNYKIEYPCIISSDYFYKQWKALMRGALLAGCDGVYLCPDEYFMKGHNLSRCTCKDCQREFKKMFGYDELPKLKAPKILNNSAGQVQFPLPVDTKQYRQWKVFEYRKLSGLFLRIARELREEFPKAKFALSDNQADVAIFGARLECTLANDIWGDSDDYDEKQVYGNWPWADDLVAMEMYCKHHLAAVGGKPERLIASGWGGGSDEYSSSIYNGTVLENFLGVPRTEYYRLNYVTGSPLMAWKRGNNMARLMKVWGNATATTPKDVAYIFSRASEDWWFVKYGALMDPEYRSKATDFHLLWADESINKINKGSDDTDLNRITSQERVRGMGAQAAVEGVIASAGIAYDVLYAERPDNMTDLKRYQTIVVPFGYSLSDQAVAAIKEAYAAGTKLVIFKRLGETDEYGEKRTTPALADLVGKPGVTFIDDCPSETSVNLKARYAWRDAIRKAIEKPTFVYERGGQPVHAMVRKLKDGEGYLVYLVSTRGRGWKNSRGQISDTCTVSFALPNAADGEWKIDCYSTRANEINVIGLGDGTDVIPAETIRKPMSISVEAQEAKLLRIYPKNAAKKNGWLW